MKKVILSIFFFTLFFVGNSAFAKEHNFNGGSGSGITYKVTTTQSTAAIVIKSTSTANQRFIVSVWSTLSQSNPSEKLGEKQIEFNTPPPRSDSFNVSSLNPNRTYYLFIHVNGSTSGDSYYQFSTDPIAPYFCTTCKLETSVIGENIIAKLSGADALIRSELKIIMMKDDFVVGKPVCTDPFYLECTVQPKSELELSGTVKWTIPISNLLGRTSYNLRAEAESPLSIGSYYISDVKKITTPDEKVRSKWPLTYKVDDTKADITGKIENFKPDDFTLKLQYSLKQLDEAGEALPADAYEVTTVTDVDGNYTFPLINLSPNRLYFVKQIIKVDSRGALEIKVNNTGFNSSTGYKAEGSKEQLDDIKRRSYTLLAPFSEKLQVVLDPDLCREFVAQKKRPAGSCDNQISDFINLIITVLIGIAAIVLVVQLIIAGYQYMVTDTPFAKVSAKSRFFDALWGLLLALSSYLILNTINPKLVSNDININNVNVAVINDYELSGLQSSRTGTVGTKVNFKKEACPAALNAEKKTGVPAALLLAIFEQETGSGKNTGACFPLKPNSKGQVSNMPANQITSLRSIISGPIDDINVSCDPGEGTGGAIGKMQSMPGSWIQYGNNGDPWSTNDAMIFTANHLIGGKIFQDGEREAACRYWAGNASSCSSTVNNSYGKKYGDSVIGKRVTYQQRIDKGDCK